METPAPFATERTGGLILHSKSSDLRRVDWGRKRPSSALRSGSKTRSMPRALI